MGKLLDQDLQFIKVGARVERALINYFLDLIVDENGYTEILPPYMVNRQSMIGTGQLPKFEEDAFKVENTGYFLIPTAEVPVTNMYRDEILKGKSYQLNMLLIQLASEQKLGSAGRDTRGLNKATSI